MGYRAACVALLLVLLVGCDPHPSEPQDVPAGVLAAAERLLPDAELKQAIPQDYTLDRIVRRGPEPPRADWATVGVRLHGPLPYARAIYYVHPDAHGAMEMFRRQVSISRMVTGYRGPDFVRETQTVCAPHPGLFWCHGVAGRVYLVTQSSTSNDADKPNRVDPELIAEAQRLVEAFIEPPRS